MPIPVLEGKHLVPRSHALPPFFSVVVAASALLNGTAGSAQPVALTNASFEGGIGEDGAPEGWAIAVYGAPPTVTADEPAPGLTGRSLRITALEASDTAVYQDLSVKPGGWYRLSGWVRTEGLVADTSLYGALCACDGPSPYRCSPNHGGDTEWVREEITFRAPATGMLRVAIFFVGFGKGTGTVWFDDLALEAISASEAACERVRVTSAPLFDGRISPFIYGNFVEFLDHHVQGMRAQMLDDVSFEGILPPAEWCYWQRDKDVEDHPWVPTGDGGDGVVERIQEGAFNGSWCYRVSIPTAPGYGHGLRQNGLCLRADRTYTVALYLRGEGLEGPVTVSLGHDYGPFVSAYASAEIRGITDEWAKYTIVLEPKADDPRAELSIRVASPGTLWIDQVTLLPDDHIEGWRRDVVEAIRVLKPRCLRFGGSAVIFYDWRQGIGDPDKRVPFPNQPWGRMEPNDVGIDEFLRLCELVEAEPLVCVSYNVGTPEDAAAQVEYCNGSTDSEWGALRAANGHPEPYGVRLWQVGNEQFGEEYERSLPAYCEAMLRVDPTLEILTAFPSDGVLETTKDLARYVCPHYYTPSLTDVARDIDEQRRRVSALAPGRDIRLGVTEWNGTAAGWGAPRALMATHSNALYCARMLHLFQRNGDFVRIANRSGLMNGWWCGNIQTTDRSLWVTPSYHSMRLLSERCGTRALQVTDEAGRELLGAEFGSVLDVAATLSEDGERLIVSVVNDGPEEVRTILDLREHLTGEARATVTTLAAEGPFVVNEEERPERVRPVSEERAVTPETGWSFPAWSLTVVEVERVRAAR